MLTNPIFIDNMMKASIAGVAILLFIVIIVNMTDRFTNPYKQRCAYV